MTGRPSTAVRLVRRVLHGRAISVQQHHFHAHDAHHTDHTLVTAAMAEISDTLLVHRLLSPAGRADYKTPHAPQQKRGKHSLSATVPKVYRGS